MNSHEINKKLNSYSSNSTSPADTQNLQHELEKYLKLTESEIKSDQENQDNKKNIKKFYEEKLEEIKNYKKENKIQEIKNLLISMYRKNSETQIKNCRMKIDNQTMTKEIKLLDDNNLTQNKKLLEFEKYNKALLEKVKEMTEEKNAIAKEESEKCETIRNKCEEFKVDFMSKFEVSDTDTIKKENEHLKEKVNEFQEHTKLIEENIRAQLDFKEKQFNLIEDGLTTQLNPKFTEFEDQNEIMKNENLLLKEELNQNLKKFEELSNVLNKFHSNFEVAKKDFEKRAQELFRLTKENRELKSLDVNVYMKENEKLKSELEFIVLKNRELMDSINKLKK